MDALDLDALKPPTMQIRLGGAVYELVPPTFENCEEFDRLGRDGDKDGGGLGANASAWRRLLSFLAPGAPAEALAKLTSAQGLAVVQHWSGAARKEAEAERSDFESTAADPSRPG